MTSEQLERNPLLIRKRYRGKFSRVSEKDRNLVEDVVFLLEAEEHPERIAARLNRSVGSIEIALRRLGRPDLALPFQPFAQFRRWQGHESKKTRRRSVA